MSAQPVDVLAVRLPSAKQMLVRSQSGHRIILEAAQAGRAVDRPRFVSEVRGFATARGTLLAWQAIAPTHEAGIYTLTERGRELLALLDARRTAALARCGGAP